MKHLASHIRHPTSNSQLFLTWDVFVKSASWVGIKYRCSQLFDAGDARTAYLRIGSGRV